MLVTEIEVGKGNKYRIFGDGNFLFSLYDKELKKYNLQLNAEVDDIVIDDIKESLIYKRAKERALFLLERKPLSIHIMKKKLQDNDYPIDVIEKVIAFLVGYHYLDDNEYVRLYVSFYSEKKSKKQLMFDLYRKGISKDILEKYFDENEYSEQKCFVRQFQKYIKGKNLQDYATRQKVFRYFYGKGFSSSLIEAYIRKENDLPIV